MMRVLFFIALLFIVVQCSQKPPETPDVKDTIKITYEEKYRPAFHFSPAKNWTNDPNGLVYYQGEYHLFYQYNPYGNIWGHMSWGHAVSKDLLHWEHLPVAIEEYMGGGDSTMIFSGSAVADTLNTSGFFPEDSTGLVAIYTSHVHRGNDQLTQHQSIAYSKDKGRTFTRYDKNPVLDIKLKDFRDPKVFWYAPEQKWVMTTVIPDKFKVHLYESKNLKDWNFLSEFGPLGDTAKIWECPDLSPITVENGKGKKKWVLLISNSHPQGPTFVGMQYFVGEFDGIKFTPENPSRYPLYLEYGKDFYAAITYNNVPAKDGRTILLGWANNWAYGQKIPTAPWRSVMTLPRELTLRETKEGYRIIQKPIREAGTLRGDTIDITQPALPYALELECEFTPKKSKVFGLKLFQGEKEETILAYDVTKQEVYLDRTRSGNINFHPEFPSVERAPARLVNGKLKLHIFIDHSIIEVFINDGEQAITDQVFPSGASNKIEFFSEGGETGKAIKAWGIKSTWK
jgi:fructan beta-fructosidase